MAEQNKLMLVFDDDLAYTYVSEERRRTEITERISNRIGKEIEVVMQSNDSGRPFEEELYRSGTDCPHGY